MRHIPSATWLASGIIPTAAKQQLSLTPNNGKASSGHPSTVLTTSTATETSSAAARYLRIGSRVSTLPGMTGSTAKKKASDSDAYSVFQIIDSGAETGPDLVHGVHFQLPDTFR